MFGCSELEFTPAIRLFGGARKELIWKHSPIPARTHPSAFSRSSSIGRVWPPYSLGIPYAEAKPTVFDRHLPVPHGRHPRPRVATGDSSLPSVLLSVLRCPHPITPSSPSPKIWRPPLHDLAPTIGWLGGMGNGGGRGSGGDRSCDGGGS
jgi:hypothetical protein